MNILIYANDSKALSRMISGIWFMQYRNLDFSMPKDYDAYLAALGEESPDIIFISLPGALGMEAAMAARETCRGAHIVWFSNDEAFGAQSYRIGCDYFSSVPVSPVSVSKAMSHCGVGPPLGMRLSEA